MNLNLNFYLLLTIIFSIVILLFSYLNFKRIKGSKIDNTRLEKIEELHHENFYAFITAQLKYVMVAVVIMFVILLIQGHFTGAVALLFGTILALTLTYLLIFILNKIISKIISEISLNDITAGYQAINKLALTITTLLVALACFSIAVVYIIFKDLYVITGFILGVTIIALFMAYNSKIYLSSLKSISNINEENLEDKLVEPLLNPLVQTSNHNAIIAYCLERFETLVIIICTSLIIGSTLTNETYPMMSESAGIVYPLLLVVCSLLISLIITLFNKYKQNNNYRLPLLILSVILAGVAAGLALFLFKNIKPFISVGLGLLLYLVINEFINYIYQNKKHKNIYNDTKANFSLIHLQLIKHSYLTVIVLIISLAITVILANFSGGIYGISLLALSFVLSYVLIGTHEIFANSTTNIDEIALASEFEESLSDKTFELELLGRKRKTIYKITSLILNFLVLTIIVIATIQLGNVTADNISLNNPPIIISLVLGALLPIIYALLVARVSLKSIKDIANYLEKIEEKQNNNQLFTKTINIISRNSLLINGAVLAIPFIIGLVMGKDGLIALIIGASITALIMAASTTTINKAIDISMVEDYREEQETIFTTIDVNPLNNLTNTLIFSYTKTTAIISLAIITMFTLGLF